MFTIASFPLYSIMPFLPFLCIVNEKIFLILLYGFCNTLLNYLSYVYLEENSATFEYTLLFTYLLYIPNHSILFISSFGFCFSLGMRYYSFFEMILIQTLFWALLEIFEKS